MKKLNHVFRYAPTYIVCGVLLYCQGTAIAAPIWWPGNGHYYEVVTAPELTWTDARQQAEGVEPYLGLPGRLATIESEDENTFLDDITDSSYWVGGWQNPDSPDYSEPDGGWEWVYLSSEPEYPYQAFTYTNWWVGQPDDYGDEAYLEFQQNGTWNDLANNWTSAAQGYIVEYVPEPATLFLLALGSVLVTRRRR